MTAYVSVRVLKDCILLSAVSQWGMFRGKRACAVKCLKDCRGAEELTSVRALTAGGKLQPPIIMLKTRKITELL